MTKELESYLGPHCRQPRQCAERKSILKKKVDKDFYAVEASDLRHCDPEMQADRITVCKAERFCLFILRDGRYD